MKHPGMLINPDSIMFDDDDVISLGEPEDPYGEFPVDNDDQQKQKQSQPLPQHQSHSENALSTKDAATHEVESKSTKTSDIAENKRKRVDSKQETVFQATEVTVSKVENSTSTEKATEKVTQSATVITTTGIQNGHTKDSKSSRSPESVPDHKNDAFDGKNPDQINPQNSSSHRSSLEKNMTTDLRKTPSREHEDPWTASSTKAANNRSFVNAFGMEMKLTNRNEREEVKAQHKDRHDPYSHHRHHHDRHHDHHHDHHQNSPPRSSRDHRHRDRFYDDHRSSSHRDERSNRRSDHSREEFSQLSRWPSHNSGKNESTNKDSKLDNGGSNNDRREVTDFELPPSKRPRNGAVATYERRPDFYERKSNLTSSPLPFNANDDQEKRQTYKNSKQPQSKFENPANEMSQNGHNKKETYSKPISSEKDGQAGGSLSTKANENDLKVRNDSDWGAHSDKKDNNNSSGSNTKADSSSGLGTYERRHATPPLSDRGSYTRPGQPSDSHRNSRGGRKPRERERERDNLSDREREREKEQDRGKGKERERDRERGGVKERNEELGREREQIKERESEREKERDLNRRVNSGESRHTPDRKYSRERGKEREREDMERERSSRYPRDGSESKMTPPAPSKAPLLRPTVEKREYDRNRKPDDRDDDPKRRRRSNSRNRSQSVEVRGDLHQRHDNLERSEYSRQPPRNNLERPPPPRTDSNRSRRRDDRSHYRW